ncbi:hypothetical protein Q6314_26905, partial [Klebsiella pneumoniae]
MTKLTNEEVLYCLVVFFDLVSKELQGAVVLPFGLNLVDQLKSEPAAIRGDKGQPVVLPVSEVEVTWFGELF